MVPSCHLCHLCGMARPTNRSLLCEADNFFIFLRWMKLKSCTLMERALNFPFFFLFRFGKKTYRISKLSQQLFRSKLRKCPPNHVPCIPVSQFHTLFPRQPFTILSLSNVFTNRSSIFRHLYGILEEHNEAVCWHGWMSYLCAEQLVRCDTTRRDAAERRPVDCVYSFVEVWVFC